MMTKPVLVVLFIYPYTTQKGLVKKVEEQQVSGSAQNKEVVFYEDGEPKIDGELGDLKFRIQTAPHERFRREGNDLHTTVMISLLVMTAIAVLVEDRLGRRPLLIGDVSGIHCHSEESISINSEGRIGKVSSSTTFNGLNHSASIPKASLTFEKSGISENSRENQDQPSPISVLEAPFEDDASSGICQPSPSLISAHPRKSIVKFSYRANLKDLNTGESPRNIITKLLRTLQGFVQGM